jgi:hypothetical protein
MNTDYLFSNKCAGCGLRIMTTATDKLGTLPVVFCDRACETSYRESKKFLKPTVVGKYNSTDSEERLIGAGDRMKKLYPNQRNSPTVYIPTELPNL